MLFPASWLGNGFHANLWYPWQQIPRYQMFGFLDGKCICDFSYIYINFCFFSTEGLTWLSKEVIYEQGFYLYREQMTYLKYVSCKTSQPGKNNCVFFFTAGLIRSAMICCQLRSQLCWLVSPMRISWVMMKCKLDVLLDFA